MRMLLNTDLRTIRHMLIVLAVSMIQLTGCTNNKPDDVSLQPYTSDWKSLERHSTPAWLIDAKYGIYVHWGIYSVPANGEQYSRNMYLSGTKEKRDHLETYGSLTTFGYKDFIPSFNAEHFDHVEWAELFNESGARFAGTVAEYRDGFSMWDSDVSAWNAMDMGPGRDVVGELEKAVRNKGMKFISVFAHQWHWGWFPTYDTETDTAEPAYEGLYGPVVASDAFKYTNPNPPPTTLFLKNWLAKVEEVIDRYRPDVLYFSGRMGIIDEQYRKDMLTHYYNTTAASGQDVFVAYKTEKLELNLGLFQKKTEESDDITIVDSSVVNKSYGYTWNAVYKASDKLITELIDTVSKNGVYLLNITPRADGVIPDQVCNRLKTIGDWLNVNGEAIYGTRPWEVYGELPGSGVLPDVKMRAAYNTLKQSIRFTQSADGRCLYAIFLNWPGEEALITSLNPDTTKLHGDVDSISMLGSDRELSWSQDEFGVTVQMSDQDKCEYAIVLKIVWSNK